MFTFSKSTPTNRTKNLSGRGNTNIDALFSTFLCTELPEETRKLLIAQVTYKIGIFFLLAVWKKMYSSEKSQFTRCNTLQHTATHCNTFDILQDSFLGRPLWKGPSILKSAELFPPEHPDQRMYAHASGMRCVLQGVAGCCGVLHGVAGCCSVLRCLMRKVPCFFPRSTPTHECLYMCRESDVCCRAGCCRVLQGVAVSEIRCYNSQTRRRSRACYG